MQLSDIISPVSVATASIIILLSIVYYYMKNRDILPGPTGLPYFGLFPFLKDETVHLQLQEFGKKYGDLYSFTYTGNLIINLGSVKAMREVQLNKSEYFAGRYTNFSINSHVFEDGVAYVNGEAWKSLRKFFIQKFREYGLSVMKENTVGPISISLSRIIEDLHDRKGVPFDVIELLTERCTGTIRNVLFGEDGVTDEKLRKMNEAYVFALHGMEGANLILMGPTARVSFSILPVLRKAMSQYKIMSDLLMETLKNIESNMDEGHTTCIIEDFYKERSDRRRKNDPTWKYFSDKALLNSISQFLGDGIISVAYFIGCYLYALVEHPDEQEKIYKELLEVVGPTRQPTYDDKGKLPYTNAFMNEVARTSNFFSLFPSLQCTKETTVRGYRIPKGAITLLNMWQAHHDPEVYENPDKFNPSRYLPTDGKARPELPVMFGIGKRACAGEAFVMLECFLFLTNIVKNFQISEPEHTSVKSELFLVSGHMDLIFTPRGEDS